MSAIKLIGISIGIFASYFYYGILQESLFKSKYGANEEKFNFTITALFFQCLTNSLVALLALKFLREPNFDIYLNGNYPKMALSYLVAMFSSNQALQFVSYPTQVVGKSCKPIPVLIFGALFGGKRYALKKYIFIFIIVIGMVLFNLKDQSKSQVHDSWIGELLLLASLTCDGITTSIQDIMRASKSPPKSFQIMYAINVWSCVFCFISSAGTLECIHFLHFVLLYPGVMLRLCMFCLASALGQTFIYVCIVDFGPLVCSIVTTTRKFFTVLFSVVFFGNVLNMRQWIGVVVVFSGLSLDIVYGKSSSKNK